VASAEFGKCVGLLEAEFDYVYQTLRRHGLDAADAEDVAQEAFLVMWWRWSQYDGRRSLRAWLAGIVFRVAYRHRGKTAREAPAAALGGVLPRTSEAPAVPAERKRRAIARVRALALRPLPRALPRPALAAAVAGFAAAVVVTVMTRASGSDAPASAAAFD